METDRIGAVSGSAPRSRARVGTSFTPVEPQFPHLSNENDGIKSKNYCENTCVHIIFSHTDTFLLPQEKNGSEI